MKRTVLVALLALATPLSVLAQDDPCDMSQWTDGLMWCPGGTDWAGAQVMNYGDGADYMLPRHRLFFSPDWWGETEGDALPVQIARHIEILKEEDPDNYANAESVFEDAQEGEVISWASHGITTLDGATIYTAIRAGDETRMMVLTAQGGMTEDTTRLNRAALDALQWKDRD